MQDEALERADSNEEERVTDSEGAVTDRLKNAIDTRWEREEADSG